MSDPGIKGLESWEAVQKYHDEKLSLKDAEVQRLKADHAIIRDFLDKADAKLLTYEKLITELCDALDRHAIAHSGNIVELIQRARKAVSRQGGDAMTKDTEIQRLQKSAMLRSHPTRQGGDAMSDEEPFPGRPHDEHNPSR